MASSAPYLSVVVPSYNESKNFSRGVLNELLTYLKLQSYSWELILTDDGSTDDTQEKLEKFAQNDERIIVLKNKHAGKGPTVQAGMLAATGQWRLFTDFDQSTPISEIEKLWPFSAQGYEIVIGSREISGATRDKEPWYRHLMGRGFNLLVQTLAIPGIFDTQCGFKLFSAQATQELFQSLFIYGRHEERTDAYTGAFDVEVLYLALKKQYKIKEVPIVWKHNETDRVSPIKDSVRMLRDILLIRWADLQHRYP